MYVKPNTGLRVFDPVRKQFMPNEGMEVDDFDLYWARRLRDGDVIRANPPSVRVAQAAKSVDGSANAGSK